MTFSQRRTSFLTKFLVFFTMFRYVLSQLFIVKVVYINGKNAAEGKGDVQLGKVCVRAKEAHQAGAYLRFP